MLVAVVKEGYVLQIIHSAHKAGYRIINIARFVLNRAENPSQLINILKANMAEILLKIPVSVK
jgi:ribosomal protein RSM22 (predicted rRNA methylase)